MNSDSNVRSDALKGFSVVDLSIGMAGALITKFLGEAGADVIRIEMDAGDPFYEIYPAYAFWHRIKTVRKAKGIEDPGVQALLAKADICVFGGEDHPDITWRFDASKLREMFPNLLTLEIQGYPPYLGLKARSAADILAQARSGLCFEHYTDRPIVFGFPAATYGVVFQGLTGLLGALYGRVRGQAVNAVAVSYWEGALSWANSFWYDAERRNPAFDFVMPKDPHPLIFKCKDGAYIHVVLGSSGAKGRLYRILQIDDPTVEIDDSGLVDPNGGKNFFGDIDLLAAHFALFESDYLLGEIREAQIAAEKVLPPGACWEDPQARHNNVITTATDGARYVGFPIKMEWTETPNAKVDPPEQPETPLAGIRIIDLGLFVAGPYGAALLTDLGADVIKIEPLQGDPNRVVFRSFAAVNRGKRSIGVDMKTPAGREIVAKLCQSAVVVQNNFRPGVSGRLGVDPQTVLAMDAKKIVLQATGYGSSGPSGTRPGFDMVFQAFCGFEETAGGEGNPPLWNRSTMVDFAGGFMGAIATLLALIHRERVGTGASLETNLFNAAIFLMSEGVQCADGEFVGVRKLNASQSGYQPSESLYKAKDRWIAICIRSDAMAGSFASVLRLNEKLTKPFAAWNEVDASLIAKAIGKRDAEKLMKEFEDRGVWAELCATDPFAVLHNADALEAGAVFAWEDAKLGLVKQIGRPFRIWELQVPRRVSVPALGQHTREILNELGYRADQIDELYAQKIVS